MSSRGTTLRTPLRAALSTGSLCIFDGAVGELQPHGVDAADKSEESLRWIASIHSRRTLWFPLGSSDSPLVEVSADRDMESNNRGDGVRVFVSAGGAHRVDGAGGEGGVGGSGRASIWEPRSLAPKFSIWEPRSLPKGSKRTWLPNFRSAESKRSIS